MTERRDRLSNALNGNPLIAILRGVTPDSVLGIAEALVAGGVGVIEVPLNSPEPLRSIELLAERYGDTNLVGCGTVLTEQAMRDARSAGASIALQPHADAALVALAAELDMICIPGVATPTEAFRMIAAGASGLKFFPTDIVSASAVRAMKAVLPTDTLTIAVGGVGPENMHDYWSSGVDGFGLGSGLYRPGWTPNQVGAALAPYLQAVAELAR